MARSLRIAAAVFFALLALAFVALSVRSHFSLDELYIATEGRHVVCAQKHGIMFFGLISGMFIDGARDWNLFAEPDFVGGSLLYGFTDEPFLGFGYLGDDGWGSSHLLLPHWFLVLVSVSLAALLAFKRTWRFTTRRLLIATTVVGGLLGLAVYAI